MFRLSRVTVIVILALLAFLGVALLRRSFDMVAGGHSSENSEPVEVIPATPVAEGVLEARPLSETDEASVLTGASEILAKSGYAGRAARQ